MVVPVDSPYRSLYDLTNGRAREEHLVSGEDVRVGMGHTVHVAGVGGFCCVSRTDSCQCIGFPAKGPPLRIFQYLLCSDTLVLSGLLVEGRKAFLEMGGQKIMQMVSLRETRFAGKRENVMRVASARTGRSIPKVL